jgi:hypothetical protein
LNDITILMTTSSIPSHPSTEIIEECMASVREQLPDAPLIILADGLHPSFEYRRNEYEEYLNRLEPLSRTWGDCTILESEDWVHQANLTRIGLEFTATPTIAFLEHDILLHGEIPWRKMVGAIASHEAYCIRLSTAEDVPWYWQHLMLDEQRKWPNGIPMLRTRQWSGCPHLASSEWYRKTITRYFDPACRCFVESVLFGVIGTSVGRDEKLWDNWRLWMYAPEGNMHRFSPLPGRGSDEPLEQKYAYPGGGRPPDAPGPN